MLLKWNYQFIILLSSFLTGIIMGIMYDIYRVLRGLDNKNKIITAIEDVLFWIFASSIAFVFLLFTNYAILGPYAYMYIALGLYIHLRYVSKIMVRFNYRCYLALGKVLRIIINYAKYPFQLLLENKKKN